MNTKIVVDSSASLYTLQGVDFECVPLKIITDDAEYLDNGTMDAVGMAQTLRTYKGKTSTSCPNVSDWLAAYEGADEVYAITITGTLSGSYNAARLAAEESIYANVISASTQKLSEEVYGSMLLGIPNSQFDRAWQFFRTIPNLQAEEVSVDVQ